MIFQVFLNLFYMLFPQWDICWFGINFLSTFSWGHYLGFLLYSFFFMSFACGCFYTLFLVCLFTCGFFNIFQLMLLAPIPYNTKLIILDIAFEIITMLSSLLNFRPWQYGGMQPGLGHINSYYNVFNTFT